MLKSTANVNRLKLVAAEKLFRGMPGIYTSGASAALMYGVWQRADLRLRRIKPRRFAASTARNAPPEELVPVFSALPPGTVRFRTTSFDSGQKPHDARSERDRNCLRMTFLHCKPFG